MRLLLLLSLLIVSVASTAAVYRWVDENGKVHYSDEPVENAQPVELKDNTNNQVSLPPVHARTQTSTTNNEDENYNYKVTIISPVEEQTIRQNSGNFTVVAGVTPKLPSGHMLSLYLNNQLVVQPQLSSTFQLTGIDRGEHAIMVKVVTQNGKVLASSSPRTIFLHRASKN